MAEAVWGEAVPRSATRSLQTHVLRVRAALGVAAVVKFAQGGQKATGYTDTGLNLIAKKAVSGVPSKNVAYGLANCWG